MHVSAWLMRHRRWVLLLAFLLVLAVVAQATSLRDALNVTYLKDLLHSRPWSGLALFVLLFAVGNVLHLPGWIFLAAAVVVFGRTEGGLVTYVAACISCTFTFLTIRLVGGNVAETMTSPLGLRLLKHLHAHPIRNLVLLRMVFQTLPTLNYALALSGIRLRHYVLGTALGLPLPIAVYCVFFDLLVAAAHQL